MQPACNVGHTGESARKHLAPINPFHFFAKLYISLYSPFFFLTRVVHLGGVPLRRSSEDRHHSGSFFSSAVFFLSFSTHLVPPSFFVFCFIYRFLLARAVLSDAQKGTRGVVSCSAVADRQASLTFVEVHGTKPFAFVVFVLFLRASLLYCPEAYLTPLPRMSVSTARSLRDTALFLRLSAVAGLTPPGNTSNAGRDGDPSTSGIGHPSYKIVE